MTRPTSHLDWLGTQVEPTPTQKAAGFATGDRPPAQWWNWHLGTIDLWIKFLLGQHELNSLVTGGLTVDSGTTRLVYYATYLPSPTNPLDDQIIAVGTGILVSYDSGLGWGERDTGDGYSGPWYGITTAGPRVVAIADNVIYTHNDSEGWVVRQSEINTQRSIAYNGSTVVTGGWYGEMLHSTDNGLTWIRHTPLPPTEEGGDAPHIIQLGTRPGGGFYGVKEYPWPTQTNVYYSPDGVTFTGLDNAVFGLGADEMVSDIDWKPGLGWVALVMRPFGEGSMALAGVLVSTDNGVTWERRYTMDPSITIQDLELRITPDSILLTTHGAILRSSDGFDWEIVKGPFYANGPMVQTAPNSSVWINNTGTSGQLTVTAWTH